MFGISMQLFWIIVVIIFAILEAASLGLTAIWFSVGAFVAAISVYFKLSFINQCFIFVIVSALTMFFTKPIVVDKLGIKKVATNLDRTIGQKGYVTLDIDNQRAQGQVKIMGLDWTARSYDSNVTIKADTKVEVIAIQGVKAIVKPIDIL